LGWCVGGGWGGVGGLVGVCLVFVVWGGGWGVLVGVGGGGVGGGGGGGERVPSLKDQIYGKKSVGSITDKESNWSQALFLPHRKVWEREMIGLFIWVTNR